MSTINDLAVVSSVSSADKLPLWSNANGVTRGLPISVLDERYLTPADITLFAVSPNIEIFISDTLPNPENLPTFTAGSTHALTLANLYNSASNLEVHFDGTFQTNDQLSLVGFGLAFSDPNTDLPSPIPFGTQKVQISGGAVRVLSQPSQGTVTTDTIVDGAVTTPKLANGAVTGPKLASGAVTDVNVAAGSKLANRINNWVDVNDFPGVDKTGATDSTTGMQAAHNTGKLIYYPAGAYKFSTLTIPAGGIVGDGPSLTNLTSTDTGSGDSILLTAQGEIPGPGAYLFRDFILVGNNALKTAGNGMNLNPATFENQGSTFDNVWFYGHPVALMFSRASNWTVNNCKFLNYLQGGVYVNNNNVADSGDSTIGGGTVFNTSHTTGVAVFQASSGGLKISNCKLNGGGYGYLLDINNNGSTSDLMISNVSIENMDFAAVQFSRSAGSSEFSHVVIDALQIAICANGILADASNSLSEVSIGSGVTISLRPGNGSAVNFASGSNISVGQLQITANGGSPVGLAFAAACSNSKYADPLTSNVPTPVAILSTSVFRSDGLQTGALSIATTTAYGALFTGAQTVTFATPYKQTPTVHCEPVATAGGGASAFPSGVSVNGFTMNTVGVNNGGSVAVAWDAKGNI